MSLRELKVEKRKADIIKSAVNIIGDKGYHNTTMEDIAAGLLMTKGSLYYYFKNKQDLLFQSQEMLLEQSIENIEDVITGDFPIETSLHKAMVVHIEYLIEERAAFAMGVSPEQFFVGKQLEVILGLRNKYAWYFDQLLLTFKKEKEIKNMDLKIIRNILLGAMNWVFEWYSPEGKMSQHELAQKMSKYLLRILTESDVELGEEK